MESSSDLSEMPFQYGRSFSVSAKTLLSSRKNRHASFKE